MFFDTLPFKLLPQGGAYYLIYCSKQPTGTKVFDSIQNLNHLFATGFTISLQFYTEELSAAVLNGKSQVSKFSDAHNVW